MMKTHISFLFLFAFLCFQAQEITDKEAFKKCRKEFNKKTCLLDEDGDEILNYLDQCKDIPGVLEMFGCPFPDEDGDGVIDKDDACPTVAGPPENYGCPWPDTDGDGILDKDDACPGTFGLAERNGCPGKKDCTKFYEEGKLRLKMFQDESKNVDYDLLIDKIIQEVDLKLLTNDNVIVFNKVRYFLCGNGKEYSCQHQYDYDTPIFSTKDFWKTKSLSKIYNKIPKNLVFATSLDEMDLGIRFEENAILKKSNKDVKILFEGETKAIIYPKLKKNQDLIKTYDALLIEVIKNDIGNKIEVKIRYLTYNFKENEKEVNDENITSRTTFLNTYQYTNNQWKLIETTNKN